MIWLDGTHLITTQTDGTLSAWDAWQGIMMATLFMDHSLNTCIVAADGKTIIAGDEADSIHMFRLRK